MSRLDDYNSKTQEANDRIVKYYGAWLYNYNRIPQKLHLATFNEMQEYFLSDECDWMDMPSQHPDLKFVNQLRRHCRTLKNNEVAPDDRTALELIAESRIVLDWQTISEARRLLGTCWQEGIITYDQAGEIFRIMANRLLQDVFIKPIRETNVVNFSDLETSDDNSYVSNRFGFGSSNGSVSSLGKRRCRQCNKPAIDTDICKDCNTK